MDPLTIATTVVNLLIPYLSKAAESLANKAANAAWEKLEALFATVKAKLSGNPYAEETLHRVQAEPQSRSRQAALVGVLEEQIEHDTAFAETLRKLLSEAKDLGAESIVQNVSISGHARTGDVTTIGKVEGKVDVSKRK
jgi:hypothetical protein